MLHYLNRDESLAGDTRLHIARVSLVSETTLFTRIDSQSQFDSVRARTSTRIVSIQPPTSPRKPQNLEERNIHIHSRRRRRPHAGWTDRPDPKSHSGDKHGVFVDPQSICPHALIQPVTRVPVFFFSCRSQQTAALVCIRPPF